ncbi:MAG: RNB domain-containing ribonuclease [bacterium]|nr:RNB domain-containing ribonuclease [bacterium]
MAKSEKERTIEIVRKYFKVGDHISRRKFEELLLDDDSTLIENSLIAFLNTEIDNIIFQDDFTYLFNALRYIEVLIEKYPDLNRKKLKKKLTKLTERVDFISQERRSEFFSRRKVQKRIDNFNEIIYSLQDKLDTVQNNYYEFFSYFLFNVKNVNYIEQILKNFPNIINSKDKNQNSIFYGLIDNYINIVVNAKTLEQNEDLLYYNNMLSLFNSKKEFNIDNLEKTKCLQLIYDGIGKLDKKVGNYKQKLDAFSNLKSIIINDLVDKSVKNMGKYYNVKIDFAEEITNELKMYQTTYSKMVYPDRKIIGNDEMIITIDGNSAKEIDDALSVKMLPNGNYLLGIHIASVLGYLPYKSQIVQEAISRGSTIYLAKNSVSTSDEESYKSIIPILPYQFSAIDASLLEGQKRLANSYFFEIDKDGNIINKNFQKTIITNSKQMTYKEVNEIFNEGGASINKKLAITVNLLSDVTASLEKKFHPTKIYETVKQQANNPADLILGNSRSEKIVSNAMILLGSEVANWFKDKKRDYPLLLRVHEINDDCNQKLQEIINNFDFKADKEKFNYLFDSLLGIYPNGRYDISGRHDGLGLENYTHCSSVLRRSADIVNEHALDICYFNNPTDKDLYALEDDIIKNKNIINAQNNAINYFLDDFQLQKKMSRRKNDVNKSKKN